MILKSIYNSIHKMLNSKYFWPLYYALLVTLLWAVWAPALWSLFSFPEKIGDSYGGFTALVTGLSLVGIALNLCYQRRDTETQVKMLSQQLDEAKASKDALAHQAVETERLSEITALQSKLTFFSQISDSDARSVLERISREMYEHELETEIKRLFSSLDRLTEYRGKRIIDIRMGKYHMCTVWSSGIPYLKITLKILDFTNDKVSIRMELPPGYQYHILMVTEAHPGEIFDPAPNPKMCRVGDQLTLTGEGGLYFNVSMDWGLLPYSKDYDITVTSAPCISRKYIVG